MWHSRTGSRGAIVLFALLINACAAQPEPPAAAPTPAHTPSPAATTPVQTPSATSDVPAVAPSVSQPAARDPLGGRLIATVPLGGGPDLPIEAFGSLWVLAVDGPLTNDGTEPAVHRIDPETNEVVASVGLPGRVCQGIGASPEALWACGPDGLVRIDPVENVVVATVELPVASVVSRIAHGAGSVWAFATAGMGADSVVRVDPATNKVTATIALGHAAGTMAFGFGALWVTSPVDDLLLRVDPATDEVEEWATGIEGAYQLAVGASALWVSLFGEAGLRADDDEPTIVRIDPRTGEVEASIATGGALEISGGIAATDDGIWVRAGHPFLVRIDPATNEVVDRLDSGGIDSAGDVAVAFGSVWVTSELGDVLRLAP